ncbi:MAG: zinc ribbon domain-containing protein [Candidatus Omnitrophica bacterium]|nr:zinc ribbon domain-containing protein [Candidatus Omnitrophota bacterium]
MPTYDYECTQCRHSFEVSQKITAAPLAKCPKCGFQLRRLIGKGAGIIFKGSGFYATDYRKKSHHHPDTCPKIKEGCDGCKGAH